MKIDNNGRINSIQSYQKNNSTPKTGSVNTNRSGRDEVSISSEALEMAQGGLMQTDARQRAEHREKLEQIKQSVKNGTYEIDPGKVAEKIARYLLGE
ncbi:flagellar biosynthesis anti-sigma factor FlgM [Effusibacillus consociatus]|uniref:Negative regulator of flagellin synthesis n=1 Tax=Effusibacillus consociatus TaxID=1117041 RepID=A0ABV9Q4Q8_9BACL